MVTKSQCHRTFSDAISSGESGVFRLLDHCSLLPFKMGGVCTYGELSAYSIGSYNPELKRAFIHIELVSVDIRGIYNYINQQFIINEFPDAGNRKQGRWI